MSTFDTTEVSENKSTGTQFLTFMIKGEILALDIKYVKEILNYKTITKMPFMPNFIHGVLNLRGVVLPVIDLSARLHNVVSSIGLRSSILIVETETSNGPQTIGVLVDGVSEVLTLDAKSIDNPPQFGAHLRPEYISGVTRMGETFVILLRHEMVFSIEEMSTYIEKFSNERKKNSLLMTRNEDANSG
jgi:purine-binding chemotaxis protein CheW